MNRFQIDSKDAVRSLASDRCPACGRGKSPRNTFCGACYRKLPADLRTQLYRRVGQGYELAVGTAMEYLGCKEFKLPPGPAGPGLFGGQG